MRYDEIAILTLDQDGHERTCGYWYLVQTKWSPLTAFASREHLVSWLDDMGLTAEGEIPERGTRGLVVRVRGVHNRRYVMAVADLPTEGVVAERRTVDNGDYTRGVITEDAATGERTLWVCNPNVSDRPIFDYAESRAMVG